MTLEGNDASHDNVRTKFELPSLRSISEKLRQDAIEKRLKDGNNEDDEDYRKRPAKLMRFAGNKRIKEQEDENLEEEGTILRKKCMKSHQEFTEDFFKTLKQFFEAAFTIIVKRRRLCPAAAFQTVKVLGIDVPRFLHPSSLEYVEEVTKKLILFINRNITEGCVIHIIIEKNKTLHVVQRFVFRVVGSINFLKIQNNDIQDIDLDVEEVERQCASSLLDILNCDTIQPMHYPQFSRWSISIGMKKEFLQGNDEYFKELWDHDPSGGYFPWKKRPKSLSGTGRRVSCRLEFPTEIASNQISRQQKRLEFPVCSIKTVAPQEETELPAICDGNLNQTKLPETNPIATQDVEVASSAIHENKNLNTEISTPRKLITKHVSSRRQSISDDVSGIVCLPVSSFEVFRGMMFSIYGLEYPAPKEKDVMISSIPAIISSKHGRSPGTSLRLPHFRHRLLKKF
ncbi:unnamed protein product [Orchesella dallaii]|uniref:Mitotic spindle assembly checkpoint protein MAD2B n=1 Tax=Orchesella dallaii TaxID=48710 RepID=A0ABP1PRU0_9HEXA